PPQSPHDHAGNAQNDQVSQPIGKKRRPEQEIVGIESVVMHEPGHGSIDVEVTHDHRDAAQDQVDDRRQGSRGCLLILHSPSTMPASALRRSIATRSSTTRPALNVTVTLSPTMTF